MDEYENGGDRFSAWPRVRPQPRRGVPDDYRGLLLENLAPESLSLRPARFNPLGLASLDQTLDGGWFPRSSVASENDLAFLHGSFEDEFQSLLSLRSTAAEFQGPSPQSNGNGLFYEPSHTNGGDAFSVPYMYLPIEDQFLNLEGRYGINSSPFLRRGGESLSRNLSASTFSNSNRSSPDFLADSRSLLANGTLGHSNSDTLSTTLSLTPQLDRLRGKVATMATNQQGCRNLQSIMETIKTEYEVEFFLQEVLFQIGELMIDPFGNYFVQKLIELCSEQQISEILLELTSDSPQLFRSDSPQLLRICLNMHGTRVMQRLLDRVNPNNYAMVATLMAALTKYAVSLTKSTNGQHVIQHCLRRFHDKDNVKLLNQVADHCIEVATDKSGCCVLQQCVEHAKGTVRERLVKEIITNAIHLSQDRYGNYVVQHILGLNIPDAKACLLGELRGNYQALSSSKYGSNVVEKCLKESDEFQATKIIVELISGPNAAPLLVDPYGNYVIQSALEVSTGPARRGLLDLIIRNASAMRSNLYGKKILAWLEKRRLL